MAVKRKAKAKAAQKPSPAIIRSPAKWEWITMDQWRNQPDYVEYSASLLRHPLFRSWIGMLHNEATKHPANNILSADKQLGMIEGRRQILDWIELSGLSLKADGQEPIEAYGIDHAQEAEAVDPLDTI